MIVALLDVDEPHQARAWRMYQQLASSRKFKASLVGFLNALADIQQATGSEPNVNEVMAKFVAALADDDVPENWTTPAPLPVRRMPPARPPTSARRDSAPGRPSARRDSGTHRKRSDRRRPLTPGSTPHDSQGERPRRRRAKSAARRRPHTP